MLRGLYTSASGMILNDQQSDSIRNNIENMQTPGYRQESQGVVSFPRLLVNRLNASESPIEQVEKVPLGVMGTGVYAERINYSELPGQIRETGNNTDLAFNSGGYFVVETLQGERYTRNGHFQLDQAGMLRTAGGNMVMGQNGVIGPLPENFAISQDGTIRDKENSAVIDRLRIVDIPAAELQRDGLTSLYLSENVPEEMAQQEVSVQQGFIEESNVDLNGQMVKMMEVMRTYSANQKAIQTHDSLLQKAVNEIGKV